MWQVKGKSSWIWWVASVNFGPFANCLINKYCMVSLFLYFWGDVPLLLSMEATGVWGFAGSFMDFCAESVFGSCGGSGKPDSEAVGGASSAATDAASLAMERVVILPLRRPWLLAVFLPRGVFCSFPSSSSPPSHLSLSLPMSLRFQKGEKSKVRDCRSSTCLDPYESETTFFFKTIHKMRKLKEIKVEIEKAIME